MDMCLCWYYEWFCYHFPTQSLLSSFSSIMYVMNYVYKTTVGKYHCTHFHWCISYRLILQQVLRVVCAYNALYSKGKYTGEGGWRGGGGGEVHQC